MPHGHGAGLSNGRFHVKDRFLCPKEKKQINKEQRKGKE